MEEITGELLWNGKGLANDLAIMIQPTAGPLKGWNGTFFLPVNARLVTGRAYELKLVDGRSGQIVVVNQIQSSESSGVLVSFTSKGPWTE